MDLKLEYAPDPSQTELFVTYCDADHREDRDNKRSTSGMIVKMGTGAISWASRLQTIATLSTTEAEFVSAVSLVRRLFGSEICSLNLATHSLDHPHSLWTTSQP